MEVKRYDFNSIVSKTKKNMRSYSFDFEEEGNILFLAIVELIIYENNKNCALNGRQLKEVLQLALLEINSLIKKEEYDYNEFLEKGYEELLTKILERFSYKENPHIMVITKDNIIYDEEFYVIARKSIIKVWDLIDFHSKYNSTSGYIEYSNKLLQNGIINDKVYLIEDKYFKNYKDVELMNEEYAFVVNGTKDEKLSLRELFSRSDKMFLNSYYKRYEVNNIDDLITEFIKYYKSNKANILEDEFSLKALEKDGVTLDKRGKEFNSEILFFLLDEECENLIFTLPMELKEIIKKEKE